MIVIFISDLNTLYNIEYREVRNMLLSKTISIEAIEAVKIEEAIKDGEADNISDFIQKAVQYYLKQLK
jgi:hypothetical protein